MVRANQEFLYLQGVQPAQERQRVQEDRLLLLLLSDLLLQAFQDFLVDHDDLQVLWNLQIP